MPPLSMDSILFREFLRKQTRECAEQVFFGDSCARDVSVVILHIGYMNLNFLVRG
jgi:hypothetical protein